MPKGKKRISKPSLWKRNLVKKQRASGEKYKRILTNKIVPERIQVQHVNVFLNVLQKLQMKINC